MGNAVGLRLALVAVVFAAFAPTFTYEDGPNAGFVWDDPDHYIDDHLIRAGDGWWRIWFDPQPGAVGAADGAAVWNYWPLTRSSFWVDRHLFGTDARDRPNLRASHAVNVALHALNAVLLLGVLRRLRIPGAAFGALLFALHPVAVESVAWLTERKNLLSTVFFLLALDAWLRFRAEGGGRWYAATGVAYLLALLAKTSTVMFPVVLVLLDWYERRAWTPRAVLRLAPFFGLSLVAGLTSIVFERTFIGSTHDELSAGIGERIAVAGHIAWFYLGKALLPLGLSFNYPRWSIDAGSPWSYLATVAWLLLAALLWRFREGWGRPFLLGLGTFGVSLFPVLGFFGIYGMRYAHVADHWQYLPCIAVLALAAALAATAVDRFGARRSRPVRAAAVAAAALVLTGLATLTWRHSAAFADEGTLWRHTLARYPDSVLANHNLGSLLLAEGRYDEAIERFRAAIRSRPTSPEPYVNLGIALNAATGDWSEAASWWQRALEVDPEQPHALYFLAKERLAQGRSEEGEVLLKRALDVNPTYPDALRALAWLYRSQGRAEAIEPFVERARQPRRELSVGGRGLVLRIWTALGLALAGCGALAWLEARRPERPA